MISSPLVRPSPSPSSSFGLFGLPSPTSMRPLPFVSSAPSGTPPESVSRFNGSVVVVGSASGTKLPTPTSVLGEAVAIPLSVPSRTPSLSESGSSALISPSMSVSTFHIGSAPSSTPSSSESASSGSVPASISSVSLIPSPSESSSLGSFGSVSPGSMRPLRFVSSTPSGTPPESVSGPSAAVRVVGSASGMKLPTPTSVSASGVVTPTSVPSKMPSLSESGSSALISPSMSVSLSKNCSEPSPIPSSSESASSGSVPIAISRMSGMPSPSVSVFSRSSAPMFGSVSPRSTRPLRFTSSVPSGTVPSSVSASSGLVVVVGSASGMKKPALTSVSGSPTVSPTSVPSVSRSLSESGSSALISPSMSKSVFHIGSAPSGIPSSSVSPSLGSVPAVISAKLHRPSVSGSTPSFTGSNRPARRQSSQKSMSTSEQTNGSIGSRSSGVGTPSPSGSSVDATVTIVASFGAPVVGSSETRV